METGLDRRVGAVAAAAGVVAILHTATAGQAQIPCRYEVTAVIQGPWCGEIFGFPPTFGRGITEDGAVVGHYTSCLIGPSEAFLWTPKSGFVTLERRPGYTSAAAQDIDSHMGWIVGSLGTPGTDGPFAALWADGQVFDLGTLPGGDFSKALAISQGGTRIVGNWGNENIGPIHGFVYQDWVMTSLGPDLGTPSSRANDISETTGRVVGWMGSGFMQDGEAYIWDNGSVLPLGPIPGGFFSIAESINRHSEVVGWGLVEAKGFPVGQTRAFLWREGRMIDIPPPPGFTRSSAADITDGGLVLVNATGPGTASAFIWQDAITTDLNDLIPCAALVEITSARAISSNGQIAAVAHNAEGDVVAVLLTPIQPPSGDLDADCRVGILDLLSLLSEWGPCAGCPADLDDDGTVGILDLLTLLANWG